jgi:hypothetical protein
VNFGAAPLSGLLADTLATYPVRLVYRAADNGDYIFCRLYGAEAACVEFWFFLEYLDLSSFPSLNSDRLFGVIGTGCGLWITDG